MLTTENRKKLSEVVMGSEGIAAEMLYESYIDPVKLAQAQSIMDAELDSTKDRWEVDRDIVYAVYLIHTLIDRLDLANDPDEATAAMGFEHWYESRCDGLATDVFYHDFERTTEKADLSAAKAELDRLTKKGGDAE